MIVHININTNVSDPDGEISTIDRVVTLGIEIDHQARWSMPQIEDGVDLPRDIQVGISDYMEQWIAEKFDPSDCGPDPDEYYDTRNERRSA